MDIALLNMTITIQKCEAVADAAGNYVNEWMDYYTCHATVGDEDSAKAAESEGAGMTADHPGLSFTVRYCAAAAAVTSTGYRVLFGDDIYNILSVDHMNFKRKSLKLKCEKVRR
ncbi:MAG: phage head closure protein [Clostridiales bacterium]|nr:phage head closure protein [Clostridiales bacterium]